MIRYEQINAKGISIHALRGEGDEMLSAVLMKKAIFQSTPSVGRATVPEGWQMCPQCISIHALRGEGDETD